MGAISLYTQPNQGGLQSYQLATFETTDLTPGTDYTQNFLKEIHVAGLNKDCWFVKLTLASTAFDNLDVNKNNSPIPRNDLIIQQMDISGTLTNVLGPANDNLGAQALTVRPDDWEVHWRDKYNGRYFYNATPRVYYTSPITPSSIPPAFTENTYYNTNQSRYIFWTMSDCYFSIEEGWRVDTSAYQNPCRNYAQSFSSGFSSDSSTQNANMSCNSLRERGMEGPYVLQERNDRLSFQGRIMATAGGNSGATGYVPASQQVFTNFIEFDYTIEQQGGEIITVHMIGICHWRENLDGYVQEAQIVAISKNFWEGKPKPPYTGPTSHIQGGQGQFRRNSESTGDLNGAGVGNIVSNWNTALSAITSGYGKHIVYPTDGASASCFAKFINNIVNPDFWTAFQSKFSSPLSAVVACHAMPASLAPPSTGTYTPITAAGQDWTDSPAPQSYCNGFSQDYVRYHVGTWYIEEDSQSFADYDNTAVIINLPYIGVFELDISSCMGQPGAIAVDYTSDAWTGDVVAIVSVQDRNGNIWRRYSWKGNCSHQIPLATYTPPGVALATQGVHVLTNVAGGVLQFSAGVSAADATARQSYANSFTEAELYAMEQGEFAAGLNAAGREGARAGARAGAPTLTRTVGSSLGNAIQQANATISSNGSGGNATAPIDTQCWVLIIKPEWSNPDYYARECGYPSDIAGEVGDFEGLLCVSSVEVEGIDCTDDEKAQIRQYLVDGVYLS